VLNRHLSHYIDHLASSFMTKHPCTGQISTAAIL
jgi:hypothetical protein